MLLVVLLASACTLKAAHIDPQPRLDGPSVPGRIALQLDEAVADAFVVAAQGGTPPIDVAGWREAIMLGLVRGARGRFAVAPEVTTDAWRLVVTRAEPQLVALELDENGVAILFTAELAWSARLFDPSLAVVDERRGVARPDAVFRGVSDGSPILAAAIEAFVVDLLAPVGDHMMTAAAAAPVAPDDEK